MKKITLLFLTILLTSCASGYKIQKPENTNYNSTSKSNNVELSYKYDLLPKKYQKKETKKRTKLISVKIKNSSNQDLILGKNLKIIDNSDNEIYILDQKQTYKKLKQLPATHLFYLLLTPINFFKTTTSSNGQTETKSTPVGLIIGPGLALGNLAVASSANKKFKKDLELYNINGEVIKQGETKYGLIAIETDSYKSLKIKIVN